MIYAVKSVENSEVNKIYADWVSCKDLVWGKSAVYKSFPDNEYEAANKFLNSAPVAINEFGHGYIPSDLKADIVYGRYNFDAIGNGCTVVIVGDIDQLPSVGPGAVLRDIIESDVIPVIRLQKIYRQDEDAEICINAKKIKEGNTDIREGKDFHFIECSRMEDIKNAMAVQYVKDVDKYGLGNVFCLCPYIEHVAGVNDMNKCLQDLINPLKENEKHVLAGSLDFRIGDIVMHQKRNTELASNGDLGVITDIIWDDEEYAIIVSMNGRELSYDKDNIQYLTLAYAMSIHKSQGSEAKAVVACYSSYHVGMIYMNIPYVAVSRGKKNVSIFGEKAALKEAITNGCGARRITLLGYELAYLGGKFVAA